MKHPVQKFYDFVSRPLFPAARVLLLLAIVPLVLSFFYPLWRITLNAPQYPEGLYVDVFSYAVRGGNHGQHLTEINSINHYIGMGHIDRAALADLDWMPFAIGILGLLALRVALLGDVRSLIDLSVLSVYVSGFALVRFYLRMYALGHNLNPEAPFHIPPFTPPVFGSREIANFTSSSYPQAGAIWLGVFLATVAGTMLWHLIGGLVQAVRAERGVTPTAKPKGDARAKEAAKAEAPTSAEPAAVTAKSEAPAGALATDAPKAATRKSEPPSVAAVKDEVPA